MTELAGLIGDPVRHSHSRRLHEAAYAALGLDWSYAAFRVRPGDVPAALGGARALGFRGLSVTMPHKAAVARAVDQRSRAVELLEGGNTVTFVSGISIAESTDGQGLLDDLVEAGFDPAGKRCAVIGAGGAARAAVLALGAAGAASVLVLNRSLVRAQRAAGLAGAAGRYADLSSSSELGDCDLVVQATPIGMPSAGASGLALSAELGTLLGAGQLALDMIYAPSVTPFLEAAASKGASVRNGLGMLVCQAALQVERWTGLAPPRDAMRAAVGETAL